MPSVKILIQGYARQKNGVEHASPATVLIEDSGKKILVDPGSNKKLLLSALKREHLKPNDIDAIFITHWHPDHILNIRLFPDAVIYDIDETYRNDTIKEHNNTVPGTNIKIIPTPGHAHGHASLLIETDQERVVVAGDIFWWTDDQKQRTDRKSLLSLNDPYVKNKKALRQSRQKLLKLADRVIPGHGKMFKVEK